MPTVHSQQLVLSRRLGHTSALCVCARAHLCVCVCVCVRACVHVCVAVAVAVVFVFSSKGLRTQANV